MISKNSSKTWSHGEMGRRGREPPLRSAPAALWISRRRAARWRDASGDLGGQTDPFYLGQQV